MATEASRPSSSFGRKLRLALWVAVAVVAAGLVGILVWSFVDRDGPTRHEVVGAYITEVNRVQIGASRELNQVNDLYRRFGSTPAALAKQHPELVEAAAAVETVRGEVAALDPPPEARVLHERIVELLSLQAAFAAEVAEFARYLPELVEAQEPLAAAIARVRAESEKAETTAEQAQAFAAYAAATRKVAGRVERLVAPTAFERTQKAQVGQLRAIAGLASRIAVALREERPDDAVRLVNRLGEEAAAVTVVRAERAAALAYNRRLREVGRLVLGVERERTRLERSLR